MKRDKNKAKGANYLIIGNSIAAIGAIEAIRQIDTSNPITVISDESYPAYSRPAIAHFLDGSIKPSAMYIRETSYYSDNNVQTLFQKRAINIDTDKKEVILDDKGRVSYYKLLLATGGMPIFPDIKGKDKKNVFTFTRLDDSRAIEKAINSKPKARKAVVLGGGLIGMCVTEALEHLGVKVTVVELAERILKPAMDETAGRMLTSRLIAQGIDIVTSDTLIEIIGRAKATGVKLKSGKRLPCDIVVVAIGVRPNTDIVKDTPIKTNRGILIDGHCMTNVEGIYAAGDAVESYDSLFNENRVIPIWPNAYTQGRIAGLNMAGKTTEYDGGFAMNSFSFYDIPIITAGINDPPPQAHGYEVLSKLDEEKNTYRKIVLRNNVIVGYIFVGEIEKSGIVTYLIKNKVDVSEFKERLLDDDFGFISFPEGFRKERLEQPV